MYLPQFTFCWMICFMRFARFESTCARLFGCADFMKVSFYRKICFLVPIVYFSVEVILAFSCCPGLERKDSRLSAKTGRYLQMSFFPPIFASIFLPKVFYTLVTFFSNLGSIWCVRWKYSSLTFFGKRFRFSQNISPSFVCDLHIQDYSNLFRPNKFWLLG